MKIFKILIVPFLLSLMACQTVATKNNENSPKYMSVDDALSQLGAGFSSLDYKLNSGNTKTGLIAKETTVKFNLSNVKSADGKLALALTNPVVIDKNNKGATLTASGEKLKKTESSNAISITFVSSLEYLKSTTISEVCEPKLDAKGNRVRDAKKKEVIVCTKKTVVSPLDIEKLKVLEQWQQNIGKTFKEDKQLDK